MSAYPLVHRSRAGRVVLAVAISALLTAGLTSSSFARPRLGGGGGGNIGGHFSGTVHFSGGGVHPGYRPIPPHPHPHPVVPRPIPRPIPHPPRPPLPPPYPHPYPYPHPAWWIPGVAAWSNAWDSTTLIYVLPSHCEVVQVNSIKYAECGSTWYEMVYHGTQLAYLPVPDPR